MPSGLKRLEAAEAEVARELRLTQARSEYRGAMSFSDSNAVFKKRAEAVGLTQAIITRFEDSGLKSMALLAFACNYNPSHADDTSLKELAQTVIGREATLVEMSSIRRLFNEAYATIASDIRVQAEQTEETAVRRLAPADRADRLKVQQDKLKGLDIRGAHEPGDSLVDKCVAMYEADRLQYVTWASAVSREHELLHASKHEKLLALDPSGNLRLSKRTDEQSCDASNEILLRNCLVRRALALDQANVIGFEHMDAWTNKLLEVRVAEAPAGYLKVSFQQLELADKRLFILLAEGTRAGIRANAAGRPLDDIARDTMKHPEVLILLQPKPASSGARADVTDTEAIVKKQRTDQFKGNGKGKGKAASFQRAPTELLQLGCVASTPKGHRLCFAFNLKSCKGPAKQKCERGLHLCAVKGCLKAHPAVECPSRGKAE